MSTFSNFVSSSVNKEAYFLFEGGMIKGSVQQIQDDAVRLVVVDGPHKGSVFALHYSQLVFLLSTGG